MTEAVAAPAAGEPESLAAALAQLQAEGAPGFDPVRFEYLAAMGRRALALPEPAATLVADRARTALQRFRADFHRAREQAGDDLELLAAAQPTARDTLQALLRSGKFSDLRRAVARLHRAGSAVSPAQLTRLLAAEADAPSAAGSLAGAMAEQEQHTLGQAPGEGAELKSFAPLRETLAALATARMLEREQRRKPADSGPLNPQRLALRSLESMSELSPAYLGRFVSYLDALFWLEKAAAGYSPPKP